MDDEPQVHLCCTDCRFAPEDSELVWLLLNTVFPSSFGRPHILDFYPCFEAEFFVFCAEQCTPQLVHVHELKALDWRHALKHDGLAK